MHSISLLSSLASRLHGLPGVFSQVKKSVANEFHKLLKSVSGTAKTPPGKDVGSKREKPMTLAQHLKSVGVLDADKTVAAQQTPCSSSDECSSSYPYADLNLLPENRLFPRARLINNGKQVVKNPSRWLDYLTENDPPPYSYADLPLSSDHQLFPRAKLTHTINDEEHGRTPLRWTDLANYKEKFSLPRVPQTGAARKKQHSVNGLRPSCYWLAANTGLHADQARVIVRTAEQNLAALHAQHRSLYPVDQASGVNHHTTFDRTKK